MMKMKSHKSPHTSPLSACSNHNLCLMKASSDSKRHETIEKQKYKCGSEKLKTIPTNNL